MADEADTRGVEAISDEEIARMKLVYDHKGWPWAAVKELIARIDAEVLKRQEAERAAESLRGHLTTSSAAHKTALAEVQRLRAAIKQSMDDSGCEHCIEKCSPCIPLAAALDREGTE